MASKEILIKIKVDGQELTVAGDNVGTLSKNINTLKSNLNDVDNVTKANSKEFKTLKGELNDLDKAFEQTTDDVKDYTDSAEQAESRSEALTNEIKSLQSQLSKLGPRTTANADEFDDLTDKLEKSKSELQENSLNAERLGENFSRIPGPIGATAGAVEALSISAKKIKGSFDLATAGVNGFGKALIATGIGAIVIAIGLLIGAAIRAFQTFEPLQEAVDNLGTAFGVLGDFIQPLIDLIGEGLTVALNGLAKAIAWVTGNLDEYNQAVADRQATDQAIENTDDRIAALEREARTANERRKEEIDLELNKLKQINELNKKYRDEKLDKDEEYYAELKSFDEEYTLETKKLAKERVEQKRDEVRDKLKAETNYYNQLTNILRTGRRGVEDLDAQIQQEAIKLVEDNFQQRLQLQQKFDEESLKLNLERNKEQIEDDRDAQKQAIIDLYAEKGTLTAEQEAQFQEELSDVDALYKEQTLKAEELYTLQLVNVRQGALKELADKSQENFENEMATLFEQEQFKNDTFALFLENRLRVLDNSFGHEADKARQRSDFLQSQAELDKENALLALNEQLNAEQITREEYNTRATELNNRYYVDLAEIAINTENEIRAARQANNDAAMMLSDSIGAVATAIGEETVAGRVLIKVQQALALATTSLALAQAFAGLGKDLAKGFPTNLIAVASTLALMATAITQFKALFGKSPKDLSSGSTSASSSGSDRPNYGKNYGDGDIGIYGPSHANGGVPATLEGGESVINKRSTALFEPLLRAMNDYGNTMKPGVAIYDAPIEKDIIRESVITKAYVVSSEMSNEQQKQARLKDISTI